MRHNGTLVRNTCARCSPRMYEASRVLEDVLRFEIGGLSCCLGRSLFAGERRSTC